MGGNKDGLVFVDVAYGLLLKGVEREGVGLGRGDGKGRGCGRIVGRVVGWRKGCETGDGGERVRWV